MVARSLVFSSPTTSPTDLLLEGDFHQFEPTSPSPNPSDPTNLMVCRMMASSLAFSSPTTSPVDLLSEGVFHQFKLASPRHIRSHQPDGVLHDGKLPGLFLPRQHPLLICYWRVFSPGRAGLHSTRPTRPPNLRVFHKTQCSSSLD